jgi:hypothetical protein
MNMSAFRDEVQGFAARGNYHAALNVALSGMNQCRKVHDQQGVDQCLHIIEDLITGLVQEFGSKDYLEKQ